MFWPLKDKKPSIPEKGSPGDFASRRSFYFHSGIDLYCDLGQEIQAIEDGIVTNIEIFTGPNADPASPWWNETQAIMIEGSSGVLGYCEVKLLEHIKLGYKVSAGEVIATVVPVLKKDKGNGTTMLHFEHYKSNSKEHVTWNLNSEKPDSLLDPRFLLEKI